MQQDHRQPGTSDGLPAHASWGEIPRLSLRVLRRDGERLAVSVITVRVVAANRHADDPRAADDQGKRWVVVTVGENIRRGS